MGKALEKFNRYSGCGEELSGVVAHSVAHAQVLFLYLDLQPTELAVVARVVRDEAEDVLRAQSLEDPVVDPPEVPG